MSKRTIFILIHGIHENPHLPLNTEPWLAAAAVAPASMQSIGAFGEVWILAGAGAVLLAGCGSASEFYKVSPGPWLHLHEYHTGTTKCIYYELYLD